MVTKTKKMDLTSEQVDVINAALEMLKSMALEQYKYSDDQDDRFKLMSDVRIAKALIKELK